MLDRWWRQVRNEHAFSGLRLWVDLARDMKADKLRARRRERDKLTRMRSAPSGLSAKYSSLQQLAARGCLQQNGPLAGLAQMHMLQNAAHMNQLNHPNQLNNPYNTGRKSDLLGAFF